jgi:hypothetical protein
MGKEVVLGFTDSQATLRSGFLSHQIGESVGIPTLPMSDIIGLIPTTLIESNAMKRLITLIFSAALLCPMWAGAQTTPSVIGSYQWNFTSSTSAGILSPTTIPNNTGALLINTLENMILNITQPKNKEGFFMISGTALVYNLAATSSSSGLTSYIANLPVTGSMISTINNGGQAIYSNGGTATGYMATFYIGASSFTCNLSASTLSGTCIGYNGATGTLTFAGTY